MKQRSSVCLRIVMAALLAILIPACGSSGGDTIINNQIMTTLPDISLTLVGEITTMPNGNGGALSVATDATSFYVGGQSNWQIEKRNLSDGGLDATFGGGTGIVSFPGATLNDLPYTMIHHAGSIYAAGGDDPSNQWRIEKRDASTGALDTNFNNPNGFVLTPPGGLGATPQSIVTDGTNLYIGGIDQQGGGHWHLEKRKLSDGSLVTSFGAPNGFVNSDPTAGFDALWKLAVDGAYVYAVGWQETPSFGRRWRIEKRNQSDGNLVLSFGAPNGFVTTPDTGGNDSALAVAVDGGFLYVAGSAFVWGANQWKIEKRNTSDGSLVSSFGSPFGFVTSDGSPGLDQATAIAVDPPYLYVGGSTNVAGSGAWRIEKRNMNTGELASSPSNAGFATSNPALGNDYLYAFALTPTHIIAVGSEATAGGSWRIERRLK